MNTRKPNAVLRQKTAVGREAFQARAMSPAKALRLALAKSADDLFGLSIEMTEQKQTKVSLDAMLKLLSDEALLLMLDGPNGLIGVMSIDIQILSGLIEMQTTGRVVAKEAPKRHPTRTDAAMVAPLVDAFLTRFEENLSDEPDGYWAQGFRFGVRAEDLRMLGLALDAPEYNVLRMKVHLFNGAKNGEIIVVMPVLAEPSIENEETDKAETLGQQLGEVMMQVPTEINAVLHRLKMPLSSIGQLKIGDFLEIPRESLMKIRLEASPKKLLAETSLGQLKGFRAVRFNGNIIAQDGPPEIEDDMDEEFERDPSRKNVALSMNVALPMKEAVESTLQDEMDDATIAEIMALPDLPDLPPLDLEQEEELELPQSLDQ